MTIEIVQGVPRPSNRHETIEVMGDPTRGGLYLKVADPRWEEANIVDLHGVLVGVPPRFYVQCNKVVVPRLEAACARANRESRYVVERLGGYNFRHMRHNPELPLSEHAYGDAGDVNSDKNEAKYFPRGETPDPWSPAWLSIWPEGVDELFVKAWEAEGWSWGGRWIGFVDPMHFEWHRPYSVQV